MGDRVLVMVVEVEVEGAVLEVAEGEGVVETQGGGFVVPGCAEVEEGGELEGGVAVFVAADGHAVFEGEADAVVAAAGVLAVASDGLATADEELLGGG